MEGDRTTLEDPVAEYEGEYLPGRNRWGVRMEDGTIHGGLKFGDAENLEVITDGQLVEWVNGVWEDVDEE